MYFPLSQITPNLYTNGGEFVLVSTEQEYIGYYFKTSTGKYFTGKNASDKPNQELQPLVYNIDESAVLSLEQQNPETIDSNPPNYPTQFNIIPYTTLKNIDLNKTSLTPLYYHPTPTQQDYQIGEFRRYFCKKVNDITYIEISKDTHDKLVNKDPQIEYSLYIPFYISWQLTGDKQQVARTNKNIVDLTMKRLSLPKFNLYLKEDYTKYYQ
jgi:hypothetical protein